MRIFVIPDDRVKVPSGAIEVKNLDRILEEAINVYDYQGAGSWKMFMNWFFTQEGVILYHVGWGQGYLIPWGEGEERIVPPEEMKELRLR